MKSIKSTAILILGSLFVAISFAACSAEDNIPEKAPQVPSSSYPISDVHVIEKGYLKAELNKDNLLDDISQLKAEDFKYTVLSETEAKGLAERKLSDSGSSDFLRAFATPGGLIKSQLLPIPVRRPLDGGLGKRTFTRHKIYEF